MTDTAESTAIFSNPPHLGSKNYLVFVPKKDPLLSSLFAPAEQGKIFYIPTSLQTALPVGTCLVFPQARFVIQDWQLQVTGANTDDLLVSVVVDPETPESELSNVVNYIRTRSLNNAPTS